MRGTPPTHVVRMRTAPTVGPKPLLLSRHRVTAGLAVGLRARVLPTGKSPPLAPLKETHLRCKPRKTKHTGKTPAREWQVASLHLEQGRSVFGKPTMHTS